MKQSSMQRVSSAEQVNDSHVIHWPKGNNDMGRQDSVSTLPVRLRLAAIDLDGTLLGPDLKISVENRRAVAKLQAAGLEVVLASGRHHTSIEPYALQLPGVRWIVSTQGGEVSDLTRSTILTREFLAGDRVEAVLALQKELGMTAVFYTPNGILTDSTWNEEVEYYASLSGLRPSRVEVAELRRATIYKTVWMGSEEKLASISADSRVVALDVQKVRAHMRMFELMPGDVTKATGLAKLARHLGFTAGEAVVFGDAENDVPMFEWAGASFAMSHAWPAAKRSARWIAPDGAMESSLARAVDMLFSERDVTTN